MNVGEQADVLLSTRSFSMALRKTYGRNFFDGIGKLLIVIPIASYVFLVLSSTAYLVDVHRTGSISRSFRRSGLIARASLWPALIFIIICGAAAVSLDYAQRWYGNAREVLGPPPQAIALLPGIPASGLLLAAWIQRALEGLRTPIENTEIRPLCEGCGYDLTHRPMDGLCSECGLSVDSSLQPLVRRPGSDWEKEPGPRSWMKSVVDLVVAPRRFYGRLRIRTPFDAVRRFYRSQWVLIGAGGGVWLTVALGKLHARTGELFLIPITGGLMVAFIGWGLHRLLAAVVMVDWIRRKALPDYSWARKVFAYESAYLWVFCLFNGLFFSAVVLNGHWLTDLTTHWLGHRLYVFGMPPEPFAILLGNALLCCLWVWRYYIALAAIRWSNY